jgi:hypothetical protein
MMGLAVDQSRVVTLAVERPCSLDELATVH